MSRSKVLSLRATWPGLVLAVLLCGAPLFVHLGEADAENDEAGYSFAVEEMLENGDWLTPRAIPDETLALLEKPPLKFWIVAAPIRLGLLPLDAFGLRFWDALFGAAAMGYVFLIGRRLGGPLAGIASSLLLFAHTPLLFEHGLRTNNMEASVLLGYCGGMFHFLAWRDQPATSGGRRHAVAAALYFVLGFLTKFVAAVFLPLLWVLTVVVSSRDRAQVRSGGWRSWILPAGLAVVLVLPWFLYHYVRAGAELWDTLVMSHVVTRFTAALDPGHLHPWHHYVSTAWRVLRETGTLPITLVGLSLLVARTARGRLADGAAIVIWLVVPIVLISLGTSKLYHYAYPFLPPLALAGGLAVVAAGGVARRALVWVFGGEGAAGRPLDVAQFAVVALVVLSVLPVRAYAANLSRLGADEHPVRSVRDCLRRLIDGSGGPPPGLWVEGRPNGWIYFYNFRDLGPWQERDEPSDATVALNLFVPASWRPVLIAEPRFQAVLARIRSADPSLLDHVARRAGLPEEAIHASVSSADVGLVTFAHERLLLPGPYRVCATDRLTVIRRAP